MEWYWVVLYLAVIWLGVFITLAGLPGTFVIVAACALAGWSTGWSAAPGWMVIVFFLLALIAEVLEHWLGVAGARSYGSTRAGMWGSFMGGLAGALIGTPLPLLGSLLGAFLGAFLGAVFLELVISGKPLGDACRAGYGAFRGRVGAILLKTVVALSMAVTASFLLWTRLS